MNGMDKFILGMVQCPKMNPTFVTLVNSHGKITNNCQILNWSNEDWVALDEDQFRKLFKGSAVKRTKFSGLSRNILMNRNKGTEK